MINIYCESFTAPTCASFASTTNAFDSILGLTDIPNWYLATTHNSSLGDGSVRLVRSPNDSLGNVLTNGVIEGQGDPKFYVSNAYSNDINISILNNGTNADLRVHRGNAPTIPLTVAISLMTGVNGTSNWLIYNQFDPINAPEPYYKVRFIDRSVWTGEGDKGVVVDGAASYYKSRRLDW
jgi:hypothetical protein